MTCATGHIVAWEASVVVTASCFLHPAEPLYNNELAYSAS
jgi:hypothetical protein